MSKNNMSHRSLRWRFTLGFITLQLLTIIASFGLVLYIATLSAPPWCGPINVVPARNRKIRHN